MNALVVIGIVLVILKLAGLIAVSWWLVTMPFWIIPIIWVIFISFAVLVVRTAYPS